MDSEHRASSFFTSSVVEVNVQLHIPAALTSGKESSIAHWIGGCVGPRAGLDNV
jgi:hypothetical protein